MYQLFTEFAENRLSSCGVVLLTNERTNKLTNGVENITLAEVNIGAYSWGTHSGKELTAT